MEINELNKNANGGTELMGRRLYNLFPKETFDEFQIISSRVRDVDEDRKVILWLHDLAGDPEVQHLKNGGWNDYDMLVFVSHWQQQMYHTILGVPFEAGIVIQNAIDPIPFKNKREDDKVKLIYTSTPHRGLLFLHPVFEHLKKIYPQLELDVYSSFKLYGWEVRDEPFKEVFEKLENTDGIRYHGAKSNEEVREALRNADIFTYPSVWEETSCLCLIEAMSAGLSCVHSSLGALPETSLGLTHMYNYVETPEKHANLFCNSLIPVIEKVISEKEQDQVYTNSMPKMITDSRHNLDAFKAKWKNLFDSLS